MSWGDLLLRLRALVFHARVEKDLEDEVDFHLAMALLAFSAGIFVVASAALAAAYIPSRRPARIDPIQTLLYD